MEMFFHKRRFLYTYFLIVICLCPVIFLIAYAERAFSQEASVTDITENSYFYTNFVAQKLEEAKNLKMKHIMGQYKPWP